MYPKIQSPTIAKQILNTASRLRSAVFWLWLSILKTYRLLINFSTRTHFSIFYGPRKKHLNISIIWRIEPGLRIVLNLLSIFQMLRSDASPGAWSPSHTFWSEICILLCLVYMCLQLQIRVFNVQDHMITQSFTKHAWLDTWTFPHWHVLRPCL